MNGKPIATKNKWNYFKNKTTQYIVNMKRFLYRKNYRGNLHWKWGGTYKTKDWRFGEGPE